MFRTLIFSLGCRPWSASYWLCWTPYFFRSQSQWTSHSFQVENYGFSGLWWSGSNCPRNDQRSSAYSGSKDTIKLYYFVRRMSRWKSRVIFGWWIVWQKKATNHTFSEVLIALYFLLILLFLCLNKYWNKILNLKHIRFLVSKLFMVRLRCCMVFDEAGFDVPDFT